MRDGDKRSFPVAVGIPAANDPVALDRAACDLLSEATGTPFRQWSRAQADPESQIRHAERIGLGNPAYRLLKLSSWSALSLPQDRLGIDRVFADIILDVDWGGAYTLKRCLFAPPKPMTRFHVFFYV